MKISIKRISIVCLCGMMGFQNVFAFSDVVGSEYEEEIKYFEDLNIVSGYEDGNFLPDNKISRAELAVLLRKITENDLTEGRKEAAEHFGAYFEDVPTEHWAYRDIQEVWYDRIVKTDNENVFEPDSFVTAGELIESCLEITGYNYLIKGNNDSEGYEQYMKLAEENGFLNGIELTAADELTRAQTVKILRNIMDLPLLMLLGFNMNENGVLERHVEFMDGKDRPLKTLATSLTKFPE